MKLGETKVCYEVKEKTGIFSCFSTKEISLGGGSEAMDMFWPQ
jgi:hypothetical protein